jgi:hypothetical protein
MAAVNSSNLSVQDQRLRRRLLIEAEERGNAVVSVAEDEHGAPYSFSVGAWRQSGVSEAVVVGLPDEPASVLVNAYVKRARAGERFVPGQLYYEFLDRVPITVERVAKGWYMEFLGSAFLFYPNGDFPALQLIVPTASVRWPWSPDAPDGFGEWQPVLTRSGRPESWTPGVDGP